MHRWGRALLSMAVAILALASCSSSSATSDPGPSTATAPSSTTPSSTTPSSTAPSSTAPASPGSTAATGPQILSLSGPKSPLLCNAPTQVELHWSTHNATKVVLQINGGPEFASYANGTRDELVPLACTGDPQTYLLTAHAASGQTATRSLTITERQSSAS